MPLVVEVTLEEDIVERISFPLYNPRRGSQEPTLRICRGTREPEIRIKPMEDPELERLMIQVLLGNTFSHQFQEALREFAEGFFQAGIDYAERRRG